jgi:formylglycine-generating enzyme required for sulfatase activity
MKKHRSMWVAATTAMLVCSLARATPVNYQMVAVGDAGNNRDTNAWTHAIGAVAYNYYIGRFDVTIGQYAAFLNAVAATDTYGLYNASMGTNANVMGIQQNGTSGNFTYSVIGSPNRPITYVSWFDAARFANWMSNGQGNASTETGAYALNGMGASGVPATVVAPNHNAGFYLPSINEWYKSAYYSPTIGRWGGYYTYSTQSNTAPGNVVGGMANQANYYTAQGYSVTQSPTPDPTQNYLTDVGAFTASSSYYGTYDQTGNVMQWLSAMTGEFYDYDEYAYIAGTPWTKGWYDSGWSPSSTDAIPFAYPAAWETTWIGFRLASQSYSATLDYSAVPEIDPAGIGSVMALVSGAIALLERRRKRST